jgi:hypothetical protein
MSGWIVSYKDKDGSLHNHEFLTREEAVHTFAMSLVVNNGKLMITDSHGREIVSFYQRMVIK